MDDLLSRVVVPVATAEDAENTAEALARILGPQIGWIVGVHVIEKGGGVPDKAPMAAREANAEEVLEALANALETHEIDAETRILYGTDIPETILKAAAEVGATAVAFSPRPAGRVTRLLTGDRARALLEASPVPVISLPIQGAQDR